MTLKRILNRASTALPTLTDYYNDQGEYVAGDGDILADYVAQTLIGNYNTSSSLDNRDIIYYLIGVLDQAMTEITMVCKALETGDDTM